MNLQPSVVRKIILEEHAQIRSKIAAIEERLESKKIHELHNAISEFNHYFLKHLQTEEKILIPVIRDLDAWGAARVEKMKREHEEQVARIKKIDNLIHLGKQSEYLTEAKGFIVELKIDMAAEEKEFLSEDILKDDVITVGGSGCS